MHVLERSQRLELPADRAFAFYGDALNLEAITPPWLGRLAHRLFVARDLERIFDFRTRAVALAHSRTELA